MISRRSPSLAARNAATSMPLSRSLSSTLVRSFVLPCSRIAMLMASACSRCTLSLARWFRTWFKMAGSCAATCSSGAARRMNASAASMCDMTRSMWTEFARRCPNQSPFSSWAVTCAASRWMPCTGRRSGRDVVVGDELVDVVVELLDPRQGVFSPGRLRLRDRQHDVRGRQVRTRQSRRFARGQPWTCAHGLGPWLGLAATHRSSGPAAGLGPLPRQPPAPRSSEGLFRGLEEGLPCCSDRGSDIYAG